MWLITLNYTDNDDVYRRLVGIYIYKEEGIEKAKEIFFNEILGKIPIEESFEEALEVHRIPYETRRYNRPFVIINN